LASISLTLRTTFFAYITAINIHEYNTPSPDGGNNTGHAVVEDVEYLIVHRLDIIERQA
jgi:hypothetical protein